MRLCITWHVKIVIEKIWKANTLENTEGAIKNRQSREIGNIGYKRRIKNKTTTQHTNNVNKAKEMKT